MKNILLIGLGFIVCMLVFDVCNIYTPKNKPVITPADSIRIEQTKVKDDFREKFERSDSAKKILEQKNLQLSKQVSTLKENAKNSDFAIEVLEMTLNDTSLQQPVNPTQIVYMREVKHRDSVQKQIIASQDTLLANKDSIIQNRETRIQDDSTLQVKTENLLHTALGNQEKLERYSLQLEKQVAKGKGKGKFIIGGFVLGWLIKSKIK